MTTSGLDPGAGSGALGGEELRLPRGARPERYELLISPDLSSGRFSGVARIELEVLLDLERLVLNALELGIEAPELRPGWASAGDEPGEPRSLAIELDEERQEAAFVPTSGTVAPGRYTLGCSFSGVLNDRLSGFYRSVYVDDEGVERVIATTQFEETDARRAFPCFDEPDLKAVFDITIDEPEGMLAVSNSPELSSTALAGGGRRVRFAPTIKMSTYLVAFVVGPLEATPAVDVDGVALRVVHRPGRGHLVNLAIDAANHALRFYRDYFGLPYPGTKLDLVALPDFASGAMENLGCVTFREALLLADPEHTARAEMERVVEVIDHEIAHMWFGDLVTMRWWNGIWLNEAFATFMALCCEDDYRPEWQVFVSFARRRASALGVDGLHTTRPVEFPVRRPDEAAAMFDVLTYEKGASVLWMLEQYLGRASFREGVRRYLARHAYGNTDAVDLWEAIGAEAGEVPVREIMGSWILQGGHPLVSARLLGAGTSGPPTLELSQEPFSYLPEPMDNPLAERDEGRSSGIGSSWLVPLLVGGAGGERPHRVLLGASPERVEVERGAPVVNAGGSGFFRVGYDAESLAGLLASFGVLRPLERFNLVADTWATCLAGRARLGTLAEVLSHLGDDPDPHVWSVAIGALGLLDTLAPEVDRPLVAGAARALLLPQLERVGWDPRPGDDEQVPMLRAGLVTALGTFGRAEAVSARCVELFADEVAGRAVVDADLAGAVLAVVAYHAGQAELDAILARYRAPRDPMDEVRNLSSLGRLRDPGLAEQVLGLCLTEIRSQNAPYLIASMLSTREIGPTTWRFVEAHLPEMMDRFPANSIHRVFEGIPGLGQVDAAGTPRYADQVRSFLDSAIQGARRRLVAQSVERLEANVRLARRLPAELAELGGLAPRR